MARSPLASTLVVSISNLINVVQSVQSVASTIVVATAQDVPLALPVSADHSGQLTRRWVDGENVHMTDLRSAIRSWLLDGRLLLPAPHVCHVANCVYFTVELKLAPITEAQVGA